MLFDRPSQSDLALNYYWNALNANAPGEELARLAASVEPTELAALRRARQSKQRFSPDPLFVRRLEDTLMNIAVSNAAASLPQAQTGPTGKRIDVLDRGRAVRPAQGRPAGWRLTPAVAIIVAAAILLSVLGSLWYYNGDRTPNQVIPAATPTSNLSPDVPMYRGDPGRSGAMPGPGPNGSPVEIWSVQLEGAVQSAPALVSDVLYLGSSSGLLAIDAQSGETIWSFAEGGNVQSSPSVKDGMVYVGNSDGELFAINAGSGTVVWTFPGAVAAAAVTVVDDTVYTGSGDGFAYALDAKTGEVRWSVPIGAPASRSTAYADGVVFVANTAGVLHALTAESGTTVWSFDTENDGTLGTTAVADGVVYQVSFNGTADRLWVLDADTGEELWRYASPDAPGFHPPAIGEDFLYLPGDDRKITALSRGTGEVVWQFETGAAIAAAPALVGNTLYVGGLDHFIYALNATTGEEFWRYSAGGEIDFGPIVSGGVLYTGTLFGQFVAVGGATDFPLPAPADGSGSPEAGSDTGQGLASFTWRAIGDGDVLSEQLTGMSQDPVGNIWVANGDFHQFEIFSPDGVWLESWGVEGSAEGQINFQSRVDATWRMGSIAFAADGSFYVAEAGNARVQHFDAERNFLHAWGGFGNADGQFVEPVDILVDTYGDVWVSDDQRDDIQKFSADGAFILKVGGNGIEPGKLDWQGFLAVGLDDSIWVTDPENARLQQWSFNGTFLQEIKTGGTVLYPIGIAVDDLGRIYVTDTDFPRVVVLDPTGGLIGAFSSPGANDGQLGDPGQILLDGEGNAFVFDTLMQLQKFKLNPPLVD